MTNDSDARSDDNSGTTPPKVTVGDVATDGLERADDSVDSAEVDEDNQMIVVKVLNETADEHPYTWEADQTPVMVADANPDKYKNDKVAKVVYLETLEQRYPGLTTSDIDEIVELVEKSKLKAYSFPVTRLIPVEE